MRSSAARPGLLIGLLAAALAVVAPLGPWQAQAQAQAQEPPPTTTVPDSVPPTSLPPAGEEVGEQESETVGGGTIGGEPIGGATDGGPTVLTLPLVPAPEGCVAPPLPHVVFVGRAVERDYRSVQYEIDSVRAGEPSPFASGSEISVRYGLDAQYIEVGETYLVSALVEPDLGFLVSRVTEQIDNFAGDEVIGAAETDVRCPIYDDPLRTLHPDGTIVESSVLEPFWSAKLRLLTAILLPLAVAFAIVFGLAALRLGVWGLFRGLFGGRRVRA